MSTIPPNWLGSIIKTQGAEKRAAEQRAGESAASAERGGNFAQNLNNVIENDDRDSSVYEDAEGAGSQGRPFGDGEGEREARSGEEGGESAGQAGGLDVEA